ncbi:hypothetical protein B0H17DRAFT_45202 [Mycena rosella]|uniref:Uncharacterized protein n=1 Tax=Mycena rosella TaxID=1033263 RepID=A0AAD7D715_MYCRO|nr:hypothetical protein B0H17DRAFT_45202 [Mycena rosella]
MTSGLLNATKMHCTWMKKLLSFVANLQRRIPPSPQILHNHWSNLGYDLRAVGRHKDSLHVDEEALQLRRKLAEKDPTTVGESYVVRFQINRATRLLPERCSDATLPLTTFIYGRRELRGSISKRKRGSAAFGGYLRAHSHSQDLCATHGALCEDCLGASTMTTTTNTPTIIIFRAHPGAIRTPKHRVASRWA